MKWKADRACGRSRGALPAVALGAGHLSPWMERMMGQAPPGMAQMMQAPGMQQMMGNGH